MNLAFLGDSITMGYGLADHSRRFPTVLCGRIGADEKNLGITGTLMAKAGLSRRNRTSFVERAVKCAPADCVIVLGATNDHNWSDHPIHAPENTSPEDADAYFEPAVRHLCEILLADFKPEKILFVTPYRQYNIGNIAGGESWRASAQRHTEDCNYHGHTMQDYVNVILRECKNRGIACLDLYAMPFDWESLTLDGCHPNEKGHEWIAERILLSAWAKANLNQF